MVSARTIPATQQKSKRKMGCVACQTSQFRPIATLSFGETLWFLIPTTTWCLVLHRVLYELQPFLIPLQKAVDSRLIYLEFRSYDAREL